MASYSGEWSTLQEFENKVIKEILELKRKK